MKISVLTQDLSHNCLGRAWLLAKALQRKYEVELVGPIKDGEIWKPLAPLEDLETKTVTVNGYLGSYWRYKSLLDKVNGDVIYASKPLLSTFGLGLIKKYFSGKPLVLDIDDWELGLKAPDKEMDSLRGKIKYRLLMIKNMLRTLANPFFHSYYSVQFVENLIPLADKITVSNTFLKKKFGGKIIPHARDLKEFSPDAFDKKQLRKKYNIDVEKNVVLFSGTPRPHKGVEDLIEAVAGLVERDMLFLIVGLGEGDFSREIEKKASNLLGEKFKAFGVVPFKNLPEYIALSDIVVVPQRRTSSSRGQMPAKLIDAMAMGKPIIATRVSDIPETLEGCGFIVEPQKPLELARSLREVIDNPSKANEFGERARKKCEEEFSLTAIETSLTNLFEEYEG